ncbi:hypothetical protein AVEN_245520-1, partial [Araneus ventricosus]
MWTPHAKTQCVSWFIVRYPSVMLASVVTRAHERRLVALRDVP